MAYAEAIDPRYKTLHKLGGVAAWFVAALTLGEIIVLSVYPQPGTISDWFKLFQSHPLIGLLDFWGLEVPMYWMFILVFLALYILLRDVNPGFMAIVLALALLGVAIFLATNNPFSMLSLSRQFAVATTDIQRSTLLAAGQTLLTNTNQRAVGGFNMGLFLVSIAGFMVSWVMLQSNAFSKSTAYVGMLAYALSLADYLREALTSSAVITLLVVLPGAILLIAWYVMVGRRLYRLGHLDK